MTSQSAEEDNAINGDNVFFPKDKWIRLGNRSEQRWFADLADAKDSSFQVERNPFENVSRSLRAFLLHHSERLQFRFRSHPELLLDNVDYIVITT